MKNILLLSFLVVFVGAFAQNRSSESKVLLKTERQRYSKMTEFNVNPNTLNYNLVYQRLELDLDPAVRYVAGTVTSKFIPTQSLKNIYFDLSNVLVVSEVNYHGENIPFVQLNTKEIKIDLPKEILANTTDSLSIKYAGVPDATGSAGDAFTVSLQDGVPVLYTLSEPYGAQEWFPTKQSMNDKIDKVDIKITTPDQYNVASNGILVFESNLPNNKKLTFWQTKYPIPAYLVALGITNYIKFNDTMGNPPFAFVNYLYPSSAKNTTNISNIDWTKEVMNVFENYFGAYPYRNEKYGHMQFGWGGGMEHATMSSMGSFGKPLIAHELAHQWFGDKVTCGTWNNIWLNEGFATFGANLANEKLLMTNEQFMSFLASENNYITSLPGGSVYVSDTDLANINKIFDSRLVYSKGGYVLRMIKWILGEQPFYQALKDYHNQPNLAYQYAVTEDFKNSILKSTGKDLTNFFNQWIYGQGYPIYNIKWNQTADKTLLFEVVQSQSHPSVSNFELPLPIKVIGKNGEVTYFALNNNRNNQSFSFPVNFEVASIEFNYEKQIVTKNSTVVKDSSIKTIPAANEKINIYPNPVENFLSVSSLTKSEPYEIYAMDGKLVKTGVLDLSQNINVGTFVKGVYILIIAGQDFKFIKK